MIKIENLCGGYKNRQIVNSLSTEFDRGRLTAVIGPNGSGKTTLLKMLVGILPTVSGRITIDDADASDFNTRDRAKAVAYLSQGGKIPEMTVGELVLHGRFAHTKFPHIYSEKDREFAVSSMEKLGILHLENSQVSTLSGGVRQKVYIAMALCGDSPYILLDEPTTYLDVSYQKQLMKLLKSLATEGRGIVTVVHDIPLAMEYADEILIINDGRAVKKDTPEQIYLSGVINDVFNATMKRLSDGQNFVYYLK